MIYSMGLQPKHLRVFATIIFSGKPYVLHLSCTRGAGCGGSVTGRWFVSARVMFVSHEVVYRRDDVTTSWYASAAAAARAGLLFLLLFPLPALVYYNSNTVPTAVARLRVAAAYCYW